MLIEIILQDLANAITSYKANLSHLLKRLFFNELLH